MDHRNSRQNVYNPLTSTGFLFQRHTHPCGGLDSGDQWKRMKCIDEYSTDKLSPVGCTLVAQSEDKRRSNGGSLLLGRAIWLNWELDRDFSRLHCQSVSLFSVGRS